MMSKSPPTATWPLTHPQGAPIVAEVGHSPCIPSPPAMHWPSSSMVATNAPGGKIRASIVGRWSSPRLLQFSNAHTFFPLRSSAQNIARVEGKGPYFSLRQAKPLDFERSLCHALTIMGNPRKRESIEPWREVERGFRQYRDRRIVITLPRLKCLSGESSSDSERSDRSES